MRTLALLIALLVSSVAQAQLVQAPPTQICDLAPEWRQHNYGPSCGHASIISPLRWAQLFSGADEWRRTYSGPENAKRSFERVKGAGYKCMATFDGDLWLIEYAIANRRMVAVYDAPMHVRTFVGRTMHNGKLCAVILDNNHTKEFMYIPWGSWVSRWHGLGGCAILVLSGTVPPPVPQPYSPPVVRRKK